MRLEQVKVRQLQVSLLILVRVEVSKNSGGLVPSPRMANPIIWGPESIVPSPPSTHPPSTQIVGPEGPLTAPVPN